MEDTLKSSGNPKKDYRLAVIIWVAMIATVFIYTFVVELIKKHYAPFESVGTFSHAKVLRYILIGVAIIDFFFIQFMRKKFFSKSPQGVFTGSVLTAVLCESVAMFGFALFLITGSSADYYLFMVFSLILLAVYFPKFVHWERWVAVDEKDKDLRPAETGAAKIVFTKAETVLALCLSIFACTLLWGLGMLIGSFLPIVLVPVLLVLVPLYLKDIKNQRMRAFSIIIFLASLVGFMSKLVVQVGGSVLFPLAGLLLGGLVAGSIQYKSFLKIMKKRAVKYVVLVSTIVGVCFSALLSLSLYSNSLHLPDIDRLRPAKIAAGWKITEENSGLFTTSVMCKKNNSTLGISDVSFRDATEKEYQDHAKLLVQFISKLDSDTILTLSKEKVGRVNGHTFYTYHYIIEKKGEGIQGKTFSVYFWRCDRQLTDFMAIAKINDQPSSQYTQELEEMIESIQCH